MNTPSWPKFCRWAAAAFCFSLAAALLAAEARIAFDVPAGEARDTLKKFAQQAGREIVFSPVGAIQTQVVKGQFTVREALDRLLAGTGLTAFEDAKTGGMVVRRGDDPNAPRATPENPGRRPNAPKIAESSSKASSSDEVLQLTVFEVAAERNDGYEALNTNSITGVRTSLKDLPITAQVLNQQFMADVGGGSPFDLLREFVSGAGAPVAGNGANGVGSVAGDYYAFPSGLSFRGINSGIPRRDGFLSGQAGAFEGIGIQSTEIIRGPQSLLYGATSASSLINFVSKPATIGARERSVTVRVDEFGSWRMEIDVNEPLGSKAAFRFAAARGHQEFWRDNLRSDTSAMYLQFAWKPIPRLTLRIVGETSHTTEVTAGGAQVVLNEPGNPYNGQRLRLLLSRGQTGGIFGGQLSWRNVQSLLGDTDRFIDRKMRPYLTASADFQATEWLTARLITGYSNNNRYSGQLSASQGLVAPSVAANPTGQWAVAGRPIMNPSGEAQRGARLTVSADFKLFRDVVKNSLIGGGEVKFTNDNFSADDLVLLDANGREVVNQALINNANAGRTLAPVTYWPVAQSLNGGGPFHADTRVFTSPTSGISYKMVPRQQYGVVPATPRNPLGVNNAATGLNDNHTVERAVFASFFSDWFGGRVTSLFGLRRDHLQRDYLALGITQDVSTNNFNTGVVWHATKWVSPYVSYSRSYQPANTTNPGLDGKPLPPSLGYGKEAGIKVDFPWWNISGSVAVYDLEVKSTFVTVGGRDRILVDPTGINGAFVQFGGLAIPVNRGTRGSEIALTARPSKNWRLRLSFDHISSVGSELVALPQYYNDEFNVNAQGQVTFNDGAVATVPSTPSNATSAAIPLTVAMLRGSAGAPAGYAATLDTGNGQILNLGGRSLTALGLTNRADGRTIGTGRPGLPLSRHQLGFVSPYPGGYIIQLPGEKITGYPENSMSTSGAYTFSEGALKRVRIGATAVVRMRQLGYYYIDPISGQRTLKRYPDQATVNPFIGYDWRLRNRITISTQLNAQNVFSQKSVISLPDQAGGGIIDARLDNNPRTLVWTTTVRF